MPSRRSSPSEPVASRDRGSRSGRRGRGVLAGLLIVALAWVASGPEAGAQSPFVAASDVDVEQLARAMRPSLVTVFAQDTRPGPRHSGAERRVRTRVGSGVAVQENAILTTASVVRGAERVTVLTAKGVRVPARVVGMDPLFNIALVAVSDVQLPPVLLATQRRSQVGDWVLTLGTSYRGEPTQSVGTLSTIYRDPRLPLFQLTNTAYPGNSGGAALNAKGELVGLVQGELGPSSTLGRFRDVENRPGVCIVQPVETIVPLYQQLRAEGRVAHGYLGVSTRSASVESDTEPGLRVPIGAQVEAVQPVGPAARAGLRKGDLIVGFDRERVEYADQLARWVVGSAPGTSIDLVWVRGEIRHSARIVLERAPEAMPQIARAEPVDPGRLSTTRIAEIERQIRQLNLELRRLRDVDQR